METPEKVKKVHDIYPDPDPEEEEEATRRRDSAATVGRPAFSGAINFARPRNVIPPRPVSARYPSYKEKQALAMERGGQTEWRDPICASTGVAEVMIAEPGLTIYRRSQSKLSQQELIDLQKATHFDKKELQQWYKGELHEISHPPV